MSSALLRRAAALAARLAPLAAAEAAAAQQGLPALAAAVLRQQHAPLPSSRSFASSALQQQAEAAAAQQDEAAASGVGAAAAGAAPDAPPMFSVTGRVSGPYAVQPKQVFAVVEVGGTQFKVTPDDVIVTEKLRGADVNDTLSLPRVLLLGSEEATVIGRPYIPGAYVTAAVEVRRRRARAGGARGEDAAEAGRAAAAPPFRGEGT